MKKWINPLERTIQRKQEHQQRRREDSRIESTEPVVWHLSKLPEEFSLLTVSVLPSVSFSVFSSFLFSVCLFLFHFCFKTLRF